MPEFACDWCHESMRKHEQTSVTGVGKVHANTCATPAKASVFGTVADHVKWHCAATTQDGRLCNSEPIRGTSRCKWHQDRGSSF